MSDKIFEDWFESLYSQLGKDADISGNDIFQSVAEAAQYIREHRLVVMYADGGFVGYFGLVVDLPKLLIDNLGNIEWEGSFAPDETMFSWTGKEEFFSTSDINGPELFFLNGDCLVGEQGLLNWQIAGYSV